MKSTITRLYDYTQSVIPAELLRWRVSDEEIAAQLETLSHNHAYEEDVDEVQMGDSVACRGVSAAPRWNRETLLFFPGRGLCEESLEDACVGAKLGECRRAQVPEGEVTLTVKRIVRRSNLPVGDALVQAEGIDGVSTVAQYYDWYRASKREPNRQLATYRAAAFLLDEIRDHSDIAIDQTEKDTWLRERINILYDALVEAGLDPKIPKEGFDFLTEEEAKQKMYEEQSPVFTDYVVQVYMAEKLSGQSMEQLYQQRVQQLAQENHMTVEQLERQSGMAMISGKIAYETALDQLGKYTQQFLEA